MLELTELELKHQEAPDLQSEQATSGQPWAACLTQLLEACFTDLHGGSTHKPVQYMVVPINHHL